MHTTQRQHLRGAGQGTCACPCGST